MAGVLLIAAGPLEVGRSVGMRFTDGFTRLRPSLLTGPGPGPGPGPGIVAGMALPARAARTCRSAPRTACGIGMGAAGAAVVGVYPS